MATAQIIFTALPNGWGPIPDTDGQGPRLSVLVSPRLTPGGSEGELSEFDDFTDWPEVAAAIEWAVSFDGIEFPAVASASPAVGLGFDPWTALFPPDTLVRPFALPDLSNSGLFSYPVGTIQDFARDLYTTIATAHPTDPVPLADLGALLDPLYQLEPPDIASTLKKIEDQVHNNGFAQSPGPDATWDFLQFLRFYRRPAEFADLVANGEALPPVRPPELDFHQVAALAGHHPFLQRLLSLVIDLHVLPGRTLPMGPDVEVRVRPSPAAFNHDPAPVLIRPRTLAALTATSFTATSLDPASSDHADGFLRLDDETRFTTVQIDPDGTGHKVLGFADNLRLRTGNETSESPDAYHAPALRAHGLSVARRQRAEKVHGQHLAGSGPLDDALLSPPGDPGANALLEVDNLVRGYRVDVHDPTDDRWRSLMRRQGTYAFTGPGGDTTTAVDEATTAMALTKAADPAVAPNDYYLQEELFSWTGWSLAVSRPGTAITNADVAENTSSEPLPDGFQLKLGFALPPGRGTLPRLRLGTEYRFRARLVDLAGNSLPPPEPTDPAPADLTHATPPTFYGRFDPVAAPTILHRTPSGPGESVERLVVRSDYNTPLDTTEVASRHLVPGKASEILCEELGRFDTQGPGSVLMKSVYGPIVAIEPGKFPASPGHFPAAFLGNPYLADPMAVGAVAHKFKIGGSDQLELLDYDGEAPFDVQGVRLDLVEGDDAGYEIVVEPGLGVDRFGKVLVVRLPKAEVLSMRISSRASDDALRRNGIVRWLIDSGALPPPPWPPPPSGPTLLRQLRRGEHWMVTPYRTLRLVHAVRRPLATPEYVQLTPQRFLGQTFATLVGTMHISSKSTGKLELLATWSEPIDNGPDAPEDPFDRVTRNIVALDVPLDATHVPVPDVVQLREDRHEFGDTKYRHVLYGALATTKFAEYFTQTAEVELNGTTPAVLPDAPDGVATSTVKVRSVGVEPPIAYAVGRDEDGDGEFEIGDYVVDAAAINIARTPGSEIPDGATVHVEYVALPIARTNEDDPTERDILSTARPAAPEVLYVIPTFRWGSSRNSSTVSSQRLGGGLRVYLQRPWYSSGAGEQLGVVIYPTNPFLPPDPPPDLAPYVTRWGNDPAHDTASGPVKSLVTPEDFPLRAATSAAWPLDERPDRSVVVAAHDVEYDAERRLWYCDLQVDAGSSYWPFVRLALVRYQEHSITGPSVHFSRVVTVDFAQLAPDRFVTVTTLPPVPAPSPDQQPTQGRRKVTVLGRSYGTTLVDPGPTEVQVIVERRDAAIGGELGWTQVGSPHVLTPGPSVVPGFTSWTGNITFPALNLAGQFRLVVEEHEVMRDDGHPFSASPDPTNPGPPPADARRFVYGDLLAL